MDSPATSVPCIFAMEKTGWSAYECMLAIWAAIIRKKGGGGRLAEPFTEQSFEVGLNYLHQEVKPFIGGGAWLYGGQNMALKTAVREVSDAIHSRHLPWPNYLVPAGHLVLWAATKGLDLPALLPELGLRPVPGEAPEPVKESPPAAAAPPGPNQVLLDLDDLPTEFRAVVEAWLHFRGRYDPDADWPKAKVGDQPGDVAQFLIDRGLTPTLASRCDTLIRPDKWKGGGQRALD